MLLIAVQVNVVHLGAHLEAYVNLLPMFNTLRLCNRFGRGPESDITRLPPELISIIEDFLLLEERSKTSAAWHTDFSCYQLLCDPEDHITTEQFEQYLQKAKADKTMGAPTAEPDDDDGDDDDPEDRVHHHLVIEFDEWSEAHWDRSFSWESRVGMPSDWRRGVFTQHEDLIKDHFGLNVWISHVRLEEYTWDDFWMNAKLEPPKTTVAYLTLPGASTQCRRGELTEYERDDKDFFIESGYGMPVHIPPPISQSARSRFRRMMQMLNLKPFSESSQDCLDLYADESSALIGTVENGTETPRQTAEIEPQLTMLIKHIVCSDEMD
jgi:hypothetical protein